jgi:hypothetical protein
MGGVVTELSRAATVARLAWVAFAARSWGSVALVIPWLLYVRTIAVFAARSWDQVMLLTTTKLLCARRIVIAGLDLVGSCRLSIVVQGFASPLSTDYAFHRQSVKFTGEQDFFSKVLQIH